MREKYVKHLFYFQTNTLLVKYFEKDFTLALIALQLKFFVENI